GAVRASHIRGLTVVAGNAGGRRALRGRCDWRNVVRPAGGWWRGGAAAPAHNVCWLDAKASIKRDHRPGGGGRAGERRAALPATTDPCASGDDDGKRESGGRADGGPGLGSAF